MSCSVMNRVSSFGGNEVRIYDDTTTTPSGGSPFPTTKEWGEG